MFKKMTIKVHHDKDSKNSKSIRLLGSFFWAPILQRNKIFKRSFSSETLGLKWTMCISASNCFPSTVCSLPRPCREPQWACISRAWLQKFSSEVVLEGNPPWTLLEGLLLSGCFLPQVVGLSMSDHCWSHSVQNPDIKLLISNPDVICSRLHIWPPGRGNLQELQMRYRCLRSTTNERRKKARFQMFSILIGDWRSPPLSSHSKK